MVTINSAYTEAIVLDIRIQSLLVEVLQMGVVKNEAIRDVFYIQLETGMRPGEAVAIQWGDVDFETRTLTVRKTVRRTKKRYSELVVGPTKSRRERKVPLSENALCIFRERCKIAKDTSEETLVFANNRGGLIEPNSLNRYLRQCRVKMLEIAPEGVEVPEFTAHSLRHTFATRMLEQGVPQKIVADWLGHSSTRITGDVYSHVLQDTSQSYRQKIGNVIDFGLMTLS